MYVKQYMNMQYGDKVANHLAQVHAPYVPFIYFLSSDPNVSQFLASGYK